MDPYQPAQPPAHTSYPSFTPPPPPHVPQRPNLPLPPPDGLPPKQKKPKKNLMIINLILGAVALVLALSICGVILARESANTAPLTWTTTHSFKGNGSGETATFHVSSNDWRLHWTCQPSSFYGMSFNVIMNVAYASGGSIGDYGAVNIICDDNVRSGTTDVHNVSGDVYINVNSEGSWAVDIQELE